MFEIKEKHQLLHLSLIKRASVVLLIIASVILGKVHASNSFFEMSLEELMQIEVTIATKTQVEVDSAPGMVSVVNGSELANKGYESLWEALSSLPGIQISIESTGSKILIVRGVGKTFSSGKVKVLLNGVAMNSTISATAESVMNLPIQQVEKIELIRGPGSAVHGEFSYVGVLNVITRKQGESVYVASGAGDLIKAGALINWNEHPDLNASLNLSLLESEGENLEAGLDAGDIYAPGPVNNKRSVYTAIFNLDYQNINFSLQWLNVQRGDHFGINDYLPPDERENRIEDTNLALHADISWKMSPTIDAKATLNWLSDKSKRNQQFVLSAPLVGGLITDPDAVSNVIDAEERVEVSLNLTSSGFEKHVLFSELSLAKVKVTDASQKINLNPNTFATNEGFFDYAPVISKGDDREIMSFTLQDEFFINDDLTLTTGIRYDHYDQNIGTGKTPRIALVYHASEHNTYRVQYAEAFRPPTLLEYHGAFSDTVNPEVIDTLEFGHHFQDNQTSLKSVLFYSKLKDLITFINVSPYGFSNTGDATIKGLDFEFIHRMNEHWSTDGNLSLLDTQNDLTGEALFGSAEVMANLAFNYKVTQTLELNMSINHVGDREREISDNRGKLGGQTLSNIAINIRQLGGVKGLKLKAGIKNIFSEDIRYQSPINSYVDDYPMNNSRTVWLQMDYKFQ